MTFFFGDRCFIAVVIRQWHTDLQQDIFWEIIKPRIEQTIFTYGLIPTEQLVFLPFIP